MRRWVRSAAAAPAGARRAVGGEVRPGDDADDRLGAGAHWPGPDGVLAVLGPGMAAPIIAVQSHPGKIEAFEWREETYDALKHGVTKAKLDGRVSIARLDLESFVFTPASFDGLLSIDDSCSCGYSAAPRAATFKSLKPGACAGVEAYVGLPSDALLTAFASSFAEPQIRAWRSAANSSPTPACMLEARRRHDRRVRRSARQAFKGLSERLALDALDVAAAQESFGLGSGSVAHAAQADGSAG
ncbi:MAG: hypothetical protein R3C16_02495 [Hyphomonadaceae bacterium]